GRGQPDEMTAHPVEMVGIEHSFAQDLDPDLEQARDEPTPRREDQDVERPWPVRRAGLGRRAGSAGSRFLDDSGSTDHSSLRQVKSECKARDLEKSRHEIPPARTPASG